MIKRYATFIGIRLSRLDKDELKVIAERNRCNESDLIRNCIGCLLKEQSCVVRKRLVKGR